MQAGQSEGELSQVRIGYDDALDLLDDERDEDIVRAGVALSVLDEVPAADEVMYVHQLVHEYFAGRELARAFDPELVRSEWRAALIQPTVDEVIDELDPADPLPGLPQTGWNVRCFTRRRPGRWADYEAGRISFGELDATAQGWVSHARQGDTWGLRRHLIEEKRFVALRNHCSNARSRRPKDIDH